MLRGQILRATAIPVLALNVLAACYRYVPATTTDVAVGGVYRGYLSAEGSQNVARLVGENVALFDGTNHHRNRHRLCRRDERDAEAG